MSDSTVITIRRVANGWLIWPTPYIGEEETYLVAETPHTLCLLVREWADEQHNKPPPDVPVPISAVPPAGYSRVD